MESTTLPSFDAASISGVESTSLMMSEPALLAEEMSGTKENTLPTWMAPKVVLCEKKKMKKVIQQRTDLKYHKSDEEFESTSFQT